MALQWTENHSHLSTCNFIEKFTAWRVNSTLNYTWKTDIGSSSEIQHGIHSSGSEFLLNRIAKATKSPGETKRFAFFWAAPERKQWKPFQSQVPRSSEWEEDILEIKPLLFQPLEPRGESDASHFTIFSKTKTRLVIKKKTIMNLLTEL